MACASREYIVERAADWLNWGVGFGVVDHGIGPRKVQALVTSV